MQEVDLHTPLTQPESCQILQLHPHDISHGYHVSADLPSVPGATRKTVNSQFVYSMQDNDG